MSSPALESFLAMLYTDADARARFVADMQGEAGRAGLSEAEATALCAIDLAGLEMAAASYAHKRAQHRHPRQRLAPGNRGLDGFGCPLAPLTIRWDSSCRTVHQRWRSGNPSAA
jgi:hypothetical protein